MSKQKKECDCSKHLAKIGKIVEDTDCPMSICPNCGKLVHIEPHKYKLKDGKTFTAVIMEWFDGLKSKQSQDVVRPKSVPDIEMEYNEYMYDKAVTEISKYPNLSLVINADVEYKSLKEKCRELGKEYLPIKRRAESEAAECFDVLKVYENFVCKYIGWEDEEEAKDDNHNTARLPETTAAV